MGSVFCSLRFFSIVCFLVVIGRWKYEYSQIGMMKWASHILHIESSVGKMNDWSMALAVQLNNSNKILFDCMKWKIDLDECSCDCGTRVINTICIKTTLNVRLTKKTHMNNTDKASIKSKCWRAGALVPTDHQALNRAIFEHETYS